MTSHVSRTLLKVRWFRSIPLIRLLLVLLSLPSLIACPTLALDGAIGIHDPSTIVTCNGRYYVFGTGRGIAMLTSSDGFTWQRGERVFERIPDSVKSYVPKNDGSGVWAPDVIRLNDGYYLYYSVSAWGQFVSAVGLMTNPTLDPGSPDYQWTDRGMVVHSVEGEDLNAIDPGVLKAPDGRLWLCYGSYHGHVELVELDPLTGLRIAPDSPVSIIAGRSEAAAMIFHDPYYYLFVNHGSCCKGRESSYNIRVGRSLDATGPYLDRHGEDLAQGAGTLFLASAGTQVGPGHFGLLVDDGVERFSCHYEADTKKEGRSFLAIRPLLWTTDGWPLPGRTIAEGTYQIRSRRTGTVLQAPTGSTNGTPVQTARYLIRENQLWTITPSGRAGLFSITGVAGELALESATDKFEHAMARGRVALAPFTGADSQRWKIAQLSDGSYRIASAEDHRSITAAVQVKPGNGITMQPYSGDDSQRWVITAP